MKIFKLPTCPHCDTIYRYNDVKKEINKKEHICYNCKKSFQISKKKVILFFLVLFLFAFLINIIELNIMPRLNLGVLLITNTIIILLGIILIPFFLKFIAKKKNKTKTTKTNK